MGFAGMFCLAWFTKPAPLPVVVQAEEDAEKDSQEVETAVMAPVTMTEKELQTLIYDVREKIQDYNLKVQGLAMQEKRLQTAQHALKKDIEEMNQLRMELAASVAALKNEQDRLVKSKVEIKKIETENLTSIAATYDMMDTASAAKILMNMTKNQNSVTGADDAVKILYYMSERSKAKVLASIAEIEPAVSVYVCQKLKKIAPARD